MACNVHRFTVGVELSTLIVLALTGCGSSAPANVRDFNAALNQLECQAHFKCCPSAPSKWASESACETALDTDPQQLAKVASAEADIAQGSARYDQAAAGRLLDTAHEWTASCDHPVDVRLFASELNAVVVGTLPIGTACAPGYVQCASGQCTDGVCAMAPAMSAPLADGQSCAQDADCASNRCHGTCVAVTVAEVLCALP
ncbi:MAG TPA: hypothetical protein VFF06_34195 [Polyangia bacterium]|nr:hypothetical protein [Polyangia bacterium]